LLKLHGLRAAFILLATLASVGCATPPWQGMSESEIAAWKGVGFTAEMARDWHDRDFSVKDAGVWQSQGFDAEAAKEWRAKLFPPEQAKAWRVAGMGLEEAIENREKGLTPIAAEKPEAPVESSAKETSE
jgi:hypothetical protein